MTNTTISQLVKINGEVRRLQEAVATASAGYDGVPGTQFELPSEPPPVTRGPTSPPNLFGVVPSSTPGAQGSAYQYAMGRLTEEWLKFWELAAPFIEQLDNGSYSF